LEPQDGGVEFKTPERQKTVAYEKEVNERFAKTA
jgi:hypothetical protein